MAWSVRPTRVTSGTATSSREDARWGPESPTSTATRRSSGCTIYLDGELTEERRIEIKRHLDDCPPCLDAFDFEAELREVIANRCKDRVPDALRQRIHDALAEAERLRDRAGG